MERNDIIEEYRKVLHRRKSINEEIENLMEKVNDLKRERDRDQRWLEALEERFDAIYGCHSGNKNIPWRLHCYMDSDAEVPE